MDKKKLLTEIRIFIGKYYKPEHSEISDMQMGSSSPRVRPSLFKRKESRKISAKAPQTREGDDADDLLIQAEDAGYRCEEDENILDKHARPQHEAGESDKPECLESECLFSAAASVSSCEMPQMLQPMAQESEMSESEGRKLEDLMSQLEETFSQRLLRLIREKDLDEAETYKKAYVDRRHFSKIRNDVYYTPNKKTVLALSIAMELSVDETKDLLESAGFALSMSSKFDVIILYFLKNRIYDMFEINDVLYEFDQPVFG